MDMRYTFALPAILRNPGNGAEMAVIDIPIPPIYNHKGIFDILLVLHCCGALLFSSAAIVFLSSIDTASGIRMTKTFSVLK